jgi:hypothetical protein
VNGYEIDSNFPFASRDVAAVRGMKSGSNAIVGACPQTRLVWRKLPGWRQMSSRMSAEDSSRTVYLDRLHQINGR